MKIVNFTEQDRPAAPAAAGVPGDGRRGRALGGPKARGDIGYKDEWLTPPGLLSALGPFDLDPCAPVQRPWPTAATHFTVEDDGLEQSWEGHQRVFLNPPYSNWEAWVERLAFHDNGIALLFARTDTGAFFRQIWSRASAVCFLKGRLRFWYPDGTESRKCGGAPSVLVAYGAEDADALDEAERSGKIAGQVVRLGPSGVIGIHRQPRLPLGRRRATAGVLRAVDRRTKVSA